MAARSTSPPASPIRALGVEPAPTGFRLQLPGWLPTPALGAACLTIHDHDARFSREENTTFVGTATPESEVALFTVERVLGDLSAPGSLPRRVWSVLSNRRWLLPRLRTEAARRDQPVPRIRRIRMPRAG